MYGNEIENIRARNDGVILHSGRNCDYDYVQLIKKNNKYHIRECYDFDCDPINYEDVPFGIELAIEIFFTRLYKHISNTFKNDDPYLECFDKIDYCGFSSKKYKDIKDINELVETVFYISRNDITPLIESVATKRGIMICESQLINKITQNTDFQCICLSGTLYQILREKWKIKVFKESLFGKYSKCEKICRNVLHDMYPKHIFSKERPNWLKNPNSKYCLEIDLYCDELKLAIEYQGIQHYVYTPYFHSCENDFKKQLKRDDIKKELCIKNNVKLIAVPYKINTYESIKKFICEHVTSSSNKEIQKCKSSNSVENIIDNKRELSETENYEKKRKM